MSGKRRLSDSDITEILASPDTKGRDLARKYKVSGARISQIRGGEFTMAADDLGVKAIKVAGREWLPFDIMKIRSAMADETTTIKEVAAMFSINYRSLKSRSVRAQLGIAGNKRSHGGNCHRGRLSLPVSGHPLIKKFFRIMNAERATQKQVAERAGLDKHTVGDWRKKSEPTISNFDAALNVLGYRLSIEAVE